MMHHSKNVALERSVIDNCGGGLKSKYQVVQVTISRKPINATCRTRGEILETVTCAMYLGVDVTSNLSWDKECQ